MLDKVCDLRDRVIPQHLVVSGAAQLTAEAVALGIDCMRDAGPVYIGVCGVDIWNMLVDLTDEMKILTFTPNGGVPVTPADFRKIAYIVSDDIPENELILLVSTSGGWVVGLVVVDGMSV